MNTWKELKIGDGIKYTHQDVENDDYGEYCGQVYDITDEYAVAELSCFDGDFEIDDDNCYFVEKVPCPTEEERAIIEKAIDIYWDKVDEEEEKGYTLFIYNVFHDYLKIGMEDINRYCDMWEAYYGWDCIY